MVNTLITPAELSSLPGAPFTDAVVDAAAGRIRDEAGWHIAPEVTETITVDGTSTCELILPSREIATVTAVRDVTDPAAPVTLTGWRLTKAAILIRDNGWPTADSSIEVDLTHGHDACPAQLVPLVAFVARGEGADRTVSRVKRGPFEETLASGEDIAAATAEAWSALDPYRARLGF